MKAARRRARPSNGRPLALIIEEDDRGAEIANSMLRLAGFHGVPVTRGAEALHVIDSGPVELVLMDAELNDMPGLEFLQLAQRLPHFTGTRIIVASAVHPESSPIAQKLLKLGIDAYVEKPYTLARMRHRLRAMFPNLPPSTARLSAREAEALALPGAVVMGGQKRPIRIIAASPSEFIVTGQQLPLGQIVEIRLKHRQEQFGEMVTIDLVALGQVKSSTPIAGSAMCSLDLHLARPPLEWDAMTEELPDP